MNKCHHGGGHVGAATRVIHIYADTTAQWFKATRTCFPNSCNYLPWRVNGIIIINSHNKDYWIIVIFMLEIYVSIFYSIALILYNIK